MVEVQSLFARYVVGGGVMMIALIPCLVLAVAYGIQGALNLRIGRIAPRDFAGRIREARAQGGVAQARALIAEEPHSLAEIIRHVDAHLEFQPDADVAEVLREQVESECDALLQQNSQLSVIYRVAPLMGLLGTVFGMIQTFNNFASSARPDVQQLSSGINVALITTAWGLSIAIPAHIALYMLQRRISTFEQMTLPLRGAEALHALLDRPVGRSSGAVPTTRAAE